MKQGLSLRVSQHLALTPQLQQSIRLLQLSTLEMAQEVEQMLDENPFLERGEEQAEREAFGVEQADAPVSAGEQISELAAEAPDWTPSDGLSTVSVSEPSEDKTDAASPLEESWEGDGSVEMSPDDSEWGGDAPSRNNATVEDETATAAELARSDESLHAFLHDQARCLRLSEEDQAALYFIIESINDEGYLEDGLEALAESWLRMAIEHGAAPSDAGIELREEVQQRLQIALNHVHHMEPSGVGARDLGECLRLQLQVIRADTPERAELRACALAICKQPLELLAKRDFKRLALAVNDTEAQVKLAMALIARLEPKPGRRFIDVERNVIIPDVLILPHGVDKQGTPQFRAMLNPEVMPRLKVNDIYANALKGGKGDGHAGLQQRLQEARWMIKNIQQRFDTILRVSNAITQRQKSFFIHGELAMKPMVLREIAEELGLHESTISRVTTAKYMHTPYGTYELKYFFGSGLGTDSGNNASSTAVRALIKQLIASENPKKPLSDNQLSDMLKEQGIDCARRTVAKYREALRIAPTNLRKAL